MRKMCHHSAGRRSGIILKETAAVIQKATEDKCKELLKEDDIENPTEEQVEEYMKYASDYIGNSSHVEIISLPNQE